jgi:uncharacterized protein (DUF885 family)
VLDDAPQAPQTPAVIASYRELVRSTLDLRWQLDPVAATAAGVGAPYDARLGRFARPDVKASLAAMKAMSGALEQADVDDLAEEVDRTALLDDLRASIARFEKERPHEANPEFHVTHLLTGLHGLLVRHDQDAAVRGRALAGRLREVPRFLDDARATLLRPAPVFTETAIAVAEGGRTLLREAIPAFAAMLPRSVMEDLEQGLIAARAAYDDFVAFLAGELAQRSDGDFAIGREAFDFRLHYEHALRETAPELLRYGEQRVAALERELAEAAEAMAPGVPWRALADRLRQERPASAELVARYAGAMARARRFVEERGLMTVPDGPLEVVRTPRFMAPVIPFAAYDPPGPFATARTGWFYVTVPATAEATEHCVHEIACTALHEGYPGHHLQFLAAQAQPSPVRRVIGSALTVEGWALYCEELMAAEGFLERPEERFFQRLHLLWRAARVVLDVRLHTMGMTVAKAVRYLTRTLGVSRDVAEAEVRRYCGAPAYQLCYEVGRRELQRLREGCARRAGAGFSMRRFHDEVLSYGGLPVALMRWGMGLDEA